MIGKARMDNVRMCVESVLRDGVPGDLIETGVWRGGAAIFMRGILAAWGDVERKVWVADSFAGLPARDLEAYPQDGLSPEGTETLSGLVVSLEEVRENFRRYGLLDAQVAFLEGWFKDTLPCAPLSQLAVARLDGDLYESTMDALAPLYPKLQPGGYLIVDDYGTWPACRAAVDEYRSTHGITEPLISIDWASVYWRKQG
jgi:O-methyltransferase